VEEVGSSERLKPVVHYILAPDEHVDQAGHRTGRRGIEYQGSPGRTTDAVVAVQEEGGSIVDPAVHAEALREAEEGTSCAANRGGFRGKKSYHHTAGANRVAAGGFHTGGSGLAAADAHRTAGSKLGVVGSRTVGFHRVAVGASCRAGESLAAVATHHMTGFGWVDASHIGSNRVADDG
jgi:hypothetical protein